MGPVAVALATAGKAAKFAVGDRAWVYAPQVHRCGECWHIHAALDRSVVLVEVVIDAVILDSAMFFSPGYWVHPVGYEASYVAPVPGLFHRWIREAALGASQSDQISVEWSEPL